MRPRGVELSAPRGLVPLGEIAHHILTLVPLAPLHGDVAEHVAHRGAEALRAIKHGQERLVERKAALPELAEETGNRALVLARLFSRACSRSRSARVPRMRFSPVVVTPSATTSWSPANDLPSSTSTSHSASSSRRSCSRPNSRALARMKRRETLDFVSPNASGTASAAASYSRHDRPPSTRRKRPTLACCAGRGCPTARCRAAHPDARSGARPAPALQPPAPLRPRGVPRGSTLESSLLSPRFLASRESRHRAASSAGQPSRIARPPTGSMTGSSAVSVVLLAWVVSSGTSGDPGRDSHSCTAAPPVLQLGLGLTQPAPSCCGSG